MPLRALIGDVKTFNEVVDQVIAQRDQFGQSHPGLSIKLRRHGEFGAHAGQAKPSNGPLPLKSSYSGFSPSDPAGLR
jgi:hypothetical protein